MKVVSVWILLDFTSIDRVAGTLWDEAARQLRDEGAEYGCKISDDMLIPSHAGSPSKEKIFRRYESLVREYLLDPRRPKKYVR